MRVKTMNKTSYVTQSCLGEMDKFCESIVTAVPVLKI